MERKPKFKPQNSQKFGIITQIHLVQSLTSSAQRGSFLHLLSTGPMAHETLPCCSSHMPLPRWHLTPSRGTASDPAELQILGEPRAIKAAFIFFLALCVVQAKLSVTGSFDIKTGLSFEQPDHESSYMSPGNSRMLLYHCMLTQYVPAHTLL